MVSSLKKVLIQPLMNLQNEASKWRADRSFVISVMSWLCYVCCRHFTVSAFDVLMRLKPSCQPMEPRRLEQLGSGTWS